MDEGRQTEQVCFTELEVKGRVKSMRQNILQILKTFSGSPSRDTKICLLYLEYFWKFLKESLGTALQGEGLGAGFGWESTGLAAERL